MAKAKTSTRGFRTGSVSGAGGSKKQPAGTRTKGQAMDVKAAFRGAQKQLEGLSGLYYW